MTCKLGLIIGPVIVSLLFLGVFVQIGEALTGSTEGPTLTEGQITPESGLWGSEYTFTVTYYHSGNVPPSQNQPKLYLGGSEKTMKEENSLDKNVEDGKVYFKKWIPGPENVGGHTFYFQVRDNSGENVRYPESGSFEGPLIRAFTIIELNLKRENENMVFSGSLKTFRENKPLRGESITIYEALREENSEICSTRTVENGVFSFSTGVPEGNGIFRYYASFQGGGIYGESKSDSVYFKSFSTFQVFLIPLLVVLIILIGTGHLLGRGLDLRFYLLKILLGAFLAWVFFRFLGFGFGILIGGVIIGFLLSKEVRKWTNWLKVGSFGGVIAFSIHMTMILLAFFTLPEAMGIEYGLLLDYSISQGEFLQFLLFTGIQMGLFFVLLMGLGSILGGLLRKFLR